MSGEEGTMNDAVTKLSEASFGEDWGSEEDQAYDHTTKEEREGWLRDDEVYNDPTAVHDIIYRLIADVKRLEAKHEELSTSNQMWFNEAKKAYAEIVKLEAEVERLHEICDPLLDKLAETGVVT